MTLRQRLGYLAVLLGLGVGWGSTQSLGKIAISSGYGHFGLIFWQLAIGAAMLGLVQLVRPRAFPVSGAALRFATIIAVIGTLIPNSTFYLAVARLPAGIMSILISTVPLLSFPIALSLGMDRFSTLRLAGLLCGFAAISLIALPQAELPSGVGPVWLLIAMVGPLFYAMEGNIVARWGTAGLDPVQAIFAASVVGMVLVLPLVLASGQWIDPFAAFGAPEIALILSAVVNTLMYVGYIWLARAAGAVFAAQVGYVVTIAGVCWAMALLGERFSMLIWVATALLLVGLTLVRPRSNPVLP
jgi:drug/metabolite transporter (DMT)-like permease